MRNLLTLSSIEVLESRIAPAAFFVSSAASGPDALKVFKGTSLAGTGEAESNASDFAGSSVAVLLRKGDVLVYDADNDRAVSDGDTVLVQITGGAAMVFLTDFGGGTTVGGFDKNEITGLAISDKFKGTIHTDVNGSIVTGLDKSGDLAFGSSGLTLQAASIAGLTVDGQIVGDILAGASIANIDVGVKKVNTGGSNLSVAGDISTGTAADGALITLNGGSKQSTVIFVQKEGAAGGNISGIALANGAQSIGASDGGGIGGGNAGKGGSISNVTISKQTADFSVFAGEGGAAQKGRAGGGGSVNGITIASVDTSATLHIDGGSGGISFNGPGGAGGSISEVQMTAESGKLGLIANGGFGGSGTTRAGAGGSVSQIDVNSAGGLNAVSIHGGIGGTGSGAKCTGGVGGSLKQINITADGFAGGDYQMTSGNGGNGVRAGSAGAIDDIAIDLNATVSWNVVGGHGGDGVTKGGAGGPINRFSFKTKDDGGGVQVLGGDAGGSAGAKPASGGAVTVISVENSGALGEIVIAGGAGGTLAQGGGANYKAGTGGAAANISVHNTGKLANIDISSGRGGDVYTGAGNGGKSGAVSKVTVDNEGVLIDGASIHSGTGGSFSLLAVGDGGDSGNVSDIVIIDRNEIGMNRFEVYAGFPTQRVTADAVGVFGGIGKTNGTMAGFGFGSKGGDIGDVSGVRLDAPNDHVQIGTKFAAGEAYTFGGETIVRGSEPRDPFGPQGFGGNGGDIKRVSGSVGVLDLIASGGGNAFQGKGGNGGSISEVNISEVGSFVHLIAAGDGGTGPLPGTGGSVSKISVNGDIGNFQETFSLQLGLTGMGGLVAGAGGRGNAPGAAGSISDVTATRIAAILAGRPEPDAITYFNAVTKLSKITAEVIGADLGNAGFDFVEGGGTPGFQPDDAGNPLNNDRALDGFVLVKAGGGGEKLAVAPLKLIQITAPLPIP